MGYTGRELHPELLGVTLAIENSLIISVGGEAPRL